MENRNVGQRETKIGRKEGMKKMIKKKVRIEE